MPYNPLDRSELELRFEKLFEETFSCPIEDVLIPQYRLEANGSIYRIDYAYVTETERIAIELDGHGKIKGAADSSEEFRRLLNRQNDIVQAGFTIYRFTWDDVVKRGGWKARKLLQIIFKGRLKTKPSVNPIHWLIPLGPTHVVKSPVDISSSHQKSPVYTTATVVDYVPAQRVEQAKLRLSIAAFVLLAMVTLFILFSKTSQPIPEPEPSASVALHEQPTSSPTTSEEKPTSPVQPSSTTIIIQGARPAPASHPSVVQPIAPQPAPPSPEPVQVVRPEIPTPLPVALETTSPPPTAAPAVDEIVVFNQSSLIYHKPHCYWAKKCTKNCVYIRKSEALTLGGRAAQSCNPY